MIIKMKITLTPKHDTVTILFRNENARNEFYIEVSGSK